MAAFTVAVGLRNVRAQPEALGEKGLVPPEVAQQLSPVEIDWEALLPPGAPGEKEARAPEPPWEDGMWNHRGVWLTLGEAKRAGLVSKRDLLAWVEYLPESDELKRACFMEALVNHFDVSADHLEGLTRRAKRFLADYYFKKGDPQAERIYLALLSEREGKAMGWVLELVGLGLFYSKRGDHAKAQAWLLRAPEFSISSEFQGFTLTLAAQESLALGHYEEADGLLEQAQALGTEPGNSLDDPHWETDEAMAYHRRLLEGEAQGQRAAWARYRLARSYHARGLHEEERRWYQRQTEADPECKLAVTFRAYLAVARCYEEQGDLEQAQGWWRAALPFANEHWSLQLHEKMAHSYFVEQRYAEAIEATEAQLAYAETLPREGGLRLHPVRPWLRMAESYRQLGQATEALQAYERIIGWGDEKLPEYWTAVGRAAQMYDERGEKAKAQQYYRAFMDNYALGPPERNPPWERPDQELFEGALIGLAQIGLDRADPNDPKPYGQRDIDQVYQLLARFRPFLTEKGRAAAGQLIEAFRRHPLKPTLEPCPPLGHSPTAAGAPG